MTKAERGTATGKEKPPHMHFVFSPGRTVMTLQGNDLAGPISIARGGQLVEVLALSG